jgi:hypothetical protein
MPFVFVPAVVSQSLLLGRFALPINQIASLKLAACASLRPVAHRMRRDAKGIASASHPRPAFQRTSVTGLSSTPAPRTEAWLQWREFRRGGAHVAVKGSANDRRGVRAIMRSALSSGCNCAWRMRQARGCSTRVSAIRHRIDHGANLASCGQVFEGAPLQPSADRQGAKVRHISVLGSRRGHRSHRNDNWRYTDRRPPIP